jgi:hypothetical protein
VVCAGAFSKIVWGKDAPPSAKYRPHLSEKLAADSSGVLEEKGCGLQEMETTGYNTGRGCICILCRAT